MNIETMKRAQAIQRRLGRLQEARERWTYPSVLMDLGVYMAHTEESGAAWSSIQAIPVPIERFKRECLDVIATEEAALRAEFDAL